MKTTKEINEYLNWCRAGGAIPRFKGYFPFRILMEQGQIAPRYTTIRIMYSGSIDIGYYVNENGRLEQIGIENPPPLDPQEVLSEKKQPFGWEPEQLRPKRN